MPAVGERPRPVSERPSVPSRLRVEVASEGAEALKARLRVEFAAESVPRVVVPARVSVVPEARVTSPVSVPAPEVARAPAETVVPPV